MCMDVYSVFYAKYSANVLRASALRAGGGNSPSRTHSLVGPTNLQILATPLVAAQSDEAIPKKAF